MKYNKHNTLLKIGVWCFTFVAIVLRHISRAYWKIDNLYMAMLIDTLAFLCMVTAFVMGIKWRQNIKKDDNTDREPSADCEGTEK